MITIRIFNPEHDIALAQNQRQFTAPHAGRQLHADLDYIPAFYSSDGDIVVVGDPSRARRKYEHICGILSLHVRNIEFITLAALKDAVGGREYSFSPWGLDLSVVHDIERAGVVLDYDDRILSNVRQISSRQWCADNLQKDVAYFTDSSLAKAYISERRRCVIKSPWSSTGRGVRYVELMDDATRTYTSQIGNWVENIIRLQGGITIEPYYNKVKDFGMEFVSNSDGSIEFMGLSLFQTIKGAYTGNVLACENDKVKMLAPFISPESQNALAEDVKRAVGSSLKGIYEGPFGVDFMIVANAEADSYSIAVAELNLRNTMGHVALSLSPSESQPIRLMRIEYDGSHYHLRIHDISSLMMEDTDIEGY